MIEPQVELLDLISTTVKENFGINVSLDGTPKRGGVSAELGAGYSDALYYDKSATRIIPVLFLSKDANQQLALSRLCQICNYFQRLKVYPAAESFSWLDAVTTTEPNKVGLQEDRQYIYSAIINMSIYF